MLPSKLYAAALAGLILLTSIDIAAALEMHYVRVTGTYSFRSFVGTKRHYPLRHTCTFEIYADYNPDYGTIQSEPGQKSIYIPVESSSAYILFDNGVRCPANLVGYPFYFNQPLIYLNIQNDFSLNTRFFALLIYDDKTLGKSCLQVIRIQEAADIPVDVRASVQNLPLSAKINNSSVQCDSFGREVSASLKPETLSMGVEQQ